MNEDAERAVIGLGLQLMKVSHLRERKQPQQEQTEARR
jgi:hypothetical protein